MFTLVPQKKSVSFVITIGFMRVHPIKNYINNVYDIAINIRVYMIPYPLYHCHRLTRLNLHITSQMGTKNYGLYRPMNLSV